MLLMMMMMMMHQRRCTVSSGTGRNKKPFITYSSPAQGSGGSEASVMPFSTTDAVHRTRAHPTEWSLLRCCCRGFWRGDRKLNDCSVPDTLRCFALAYGWLKTPEHTHKLRECEWFARENGISPIPYTAR